MVIRLLVLSSLILSAFGQVEPKDHNVVKFIQVGKCTINNPDISIISLNQNLVHLDYKVIEKRSNLGQQLIVGFLAGIDFASGSSYVADYSKDLFKESTKQDNFARGANSFNRELINFPIELLDKDIDNSREMLRLIFKHDRVVNEIIEYQQMNKQGNNPKIHMLEEQQKKLEKDLKEHKRKHPKFVPNAIIVAMILCEKRRQEILSKIDQQKSKNNESNDLERSSILPKDETIDKIEKAGNKTRKK